MRRRICPMLLLLLAVPVPSFAWGASAHQYIMGLAIEQLPPAIRSFFERHRDELVLRVNDPDTWRVAGWDDDANHFLDFGRPELGPYPFVALPRERGAALEKFGSAALKRIGMLPWRAEEEFGNLRRGFEAIARNAPFASSDIVLFAAVAAHYIQDAHQPLHATDNYDGQLTGQTGLHARFETALFERYRARLTMAPRAAPPMHKPRDAAFDVLLSSYQLVKPLLQADKDAAAGQKTYDERYFDRFFERARALLEQRLSASIAETTALIVGAWEEAGRPRLGP